MVAIASRPDTARGQQVDELKSANRATPSPALYAPRQSRREHDGTQPDNAKPPPRQRTRKVKETTP